ncbi:DUF1294 domain-containing protein [Streptococcus massiliensis]|uniref:DUF1294 domain-containing protein n=1 Tax=Streptococcus massiliensis TaxID=313439 RepID=UPI00034D581C|nr:DUF1294 domain-containing protein [Streptococcus massiliensis]
MKWIWIGLVLVWNVMVFALYGLDKQRARRKKYRISERTLLLSALCGAGLAALLAGKYFHHKTRKWYFWCTWLLGMVLELALIYYIWRS